VYITSETGRTFHIFPVHDQVIAQRDTHPTPAEEATCVRANPPCRYFMPYAVGHPAVTAVYTTLSERDNMGTLSMARPSPSTFSPLSTWPVYLLAPLNLASLPTRSSLPGQSKARMKAERV